mmetsp:Transcript_553/g.1030  ORF Transcript_553/g.1030 Transcript_553/m.1030 type:complete len:260 (-) Transcript_553:1376-2155(-)
MIFLNVGLSLEEQRHKPFDVPHLVGNIGLSFGYLGSELHNLRPIHSELLENIFLEFRDFLAELKNLPPPLLVLLCHIRRMSKDGTCEDCLSDLWRPEPPTCEGTKDNPQRNEAGGQRPQEKVNQEIDCQDPFFDIVFIQVHNLLPRFLSKRSLLTSRFQVSFCLLEAAQSPKRTISDGIHLGYEIQTVSPENNSSFLILNDLIRVGYNGNQHIGKKNYNQKHKQNEQGKGDSRIFELAFIDFSEQHGVNREERVPEGTV